MLRVKERIEESNLDAEKAKEIELEEKPKPARKASQTTTSISNKEEPDTQHKIKGGRIRKYPYSCHCKQIIYWM